MRPQPIVLFERLYLFSILLGVASTISYWGELSRLAPVASLAGVGFVLLAAMTTLVLLVSRRRSEVAKWVLVLITVAGLAFALPSLPASIAAGPRGWLGIAQSLLQVAAVALLFTAPGRAWLRAPRSAF